MNLKEENKFEKKLEAMASLLVLMRNGQKPKTIWSLENCKPSNAR